MSPTDPPVVAPVSEQLADIARTVADQRGDTRRWLESLIRIRSISAQPEHDDDVRASALATARLLRDAGLDEVRLLEIDGAHPAVTGSWTHPDPDAPRVLLYAHHDVQPVPTADGWSSDPFEPVERNGRLYARGAADDKAGVLAHIAAIRAWMTARGGLPVSVRVIIEGEEEIGSPHLSALLETYGDELASDVIVLTDLVNWQVGVPAITYALRGMGDVFVTVGALEQPVHSGMWGGPVPDALTGMVRLLASLHDDQGRIAVEGFADDVREPTADERERIAALDADPHRLARDVRMLDGVGFVGDDGVDLLERIWMRPAITPTGIDVPSVDEASNTLLSTVRAKLSCRFSPGQDPQRALQRLRDHLEAAAPWGLHVEVTFGEYNAAWSTEPGGAAWDAALAAMRAAWGMEPAVIGCGGSIPFVAPFSAAFGDVPCLLLGVEDPASNAHGDDESLHLDDFTRTCLTEAFLLAELAAVGDELTTRPVPRARGR